MKTRDKIDWSLTALIIVALAVLLLNSCIPEKVKDRYTVYQKLYSKQGVDSLETSAYYFKDDAFYGERIYHTRDKFDNNKVKDSLKAIDFIQEHKKFN